MVLNPRKAKLLEELPKNNWKVLPSARKAGYKESYARKQGKQLLRSALKDQARELMETATNPASTSKDIKKELVEIIGLTRQDLYNRLKYIAFDQDKDLSSAIKILASIARDSGIALNPDETPKTIVPVLNIGVRNVNEGLENGHTEPINPANILSTRHDNDYIQSSSDNSVEEGGGVQPNEVSA